VSTGIVGKSVERDPQRQGQGDESLLRAVVEVPLEPSSLDVAGGDDTRTRGGELFEPDLC
jgi:hypothetical protein